jgi:adenylate cyclase
MLAGFRERVSERLGAGSGKERPLRFAMLAIALALAALIQLSDANLPFARPLEAQTRDVLHRLMARDSADPRIVIINIDEDSLKQVGPWPWPRDRLADLAEQLLAAGASIVAFDLILTDPADSATGKIGDERLVALARQGLLVAAQAFDYVERLQPVQVGRPGGATAIPSGSQAAKASGYVGNFAQMADAQCIGNIGFAPDSDGKLRRLAPWSQWQQAFYPAFAMAIIGCRDGVARAQAIGARLPVDHAGHWAVPFNRRAESYLAIPAALALSNQLSGALRSSGPGYPTDADPSRPLAGRIALLGSSALGLADRVATPLAPSVAGVTVHANALSELLDMTEGNIRTQPGAPLGWLWLAGSITLLWLAVLAGRRLLPTALVLTGLLSIWIALAAWGTASSQAAPITAAIWGYGLLLLVHLPMEWSWVQGRLRERTQLLSRYVARPVLDELLSQQDNDPLRPRHAQITVLIADMQDYTRLTNDAELQDAAELTRGFLEQLTLPVLAHRGTLDRYTGDGLVSFWGAPVTSTEHADLAIDAAMDIVANVARFNDQRVLQGLPPVTVRIGIASGSALVGDLGTLFRIAYTAVGDCINLASRLQQLSRDLQVNIAVSSSTVDLCQRWTFDSLGASPVRGLADQQVFSPLSPARAVRPQPAA